ncbi:MAG: hypothetical protein R6W90_02380 [Ignavibacteriaceae bacterium]
MFSKIMFHLLLIALLQLTISAQVQDSSILPVKLWEIKDVYKAPESAAYDAKRNCIYVSNYTSGVGEGEFYGGHSIAKADVNGEVIELDWIKNITTPTGICIYDDKLYIVERFGVVEYDLEADKISNKYLIKSPSFINDITVGDDGSIYVSESNSDVIHRIFNGKVEKWMQGEKISKTNGVLYDNNYLIIGVNSDNYLKKINIEDKTVENIAFLGEGIIDGIKKCGDGYLVSHYLGNLYFVSQSGEVTELINTRSKEINIADFEYVEDTGLLIIPALRNNMLMGYKYKCAD